MRGADMPHVALMLTGAAVFAGLYSGYKWLSGQIEKHAADAGRMRDDIRRRASAASVAPRDLGRLEWDERAGVYKPAARDNPA